MTPHLEQRFRKAYQSVCQIVLSRLVEWKWGRVIPFAQFCAGLPYLLDVVYVSRCISCNLYAFGPICRVSASWLLTKKGPFLLPNIWLSFHPWIVVGVGFIVAEVTLPGPFFMGEHSGPLLRASSLALDPSVGMGPFFITYTLGAFRLLLVFLGGLGVVGFPPVFTPAFLFHPCQKYRQ